MTLKLRQIDDTITPGAEKNLAIEKVLAKECLCEHLGNGALISLGISPASRSPQAICPGPNLSWFNRNYSLEEMVDQIYGRGKELLSDERPHMFAKEIQLYVDHFRSLLDDALEGLQTPKFLQTFYDNMQAGLDYCKEIAQEVSYKGENLPSISEAVETHGNRLEKFYQHFKSKLGVETPT